VDNQYLTWKSLKRQELERTTSNSLLAYRDGYLTFKFGSEL